MRKEFEECEQVNFAMTYDLTSPTCQSSSLIYNGFWTKERNNSNFTNAQFYEKKSSENEGSQILDVWRKN